MVEGSGDGTELGTGDSISFSVAGWIDSVDVIVGRCSLMCLVESGTGFVSVRVVGTISVVGLL